MRFLQQIYCIFSEHLFLRTPLDGCTAQKMKFSIKDFFSKCDQIHSLLLIWSHLLKKSFIENFIFVQYGFCRNELAPNTKLNLKYEKLSSNLDVCSTSTRPIGKSDDFIRRLIDTYST